MKRSSSSELNGRASPLFFYCHDDFACCFALLDFSNHDLNNDLFYPNIFGFPLLSDDTSTLESFYKLIKFLNHYQALLAISLHLLFIKSNPVLTFVVVFASMKSEPLALLEETHWCWLICRICKCWTAQLLIFRLLACHEVLCYLVDHRVSALSDCGSSRMPTEQLVRTDGVGAFVVGLDCFEG